VRLGILGGMGDAREAVVAAVLDHGPISFAEYMELALYGPGGFYEDPPVGADRDFVTSPHIHPIFGTLVARAIEQLRDALGSPRPFRLVEVGAGDGTLARQLIGELGDEPLEYTAVERSPGARAALGTVDGVRVAETMPDAAHVILANELLDNLPFRQMRTTDAGFVEMQVGVEDGRLVEVDAPLDGSDQADATDAFLVLTWHSLRRDRGYALLIDYGDVGAPGGGVYGYRAQRVLDLELDRPGSMDITSGVDFARVAHSAEALGLVAFPTVTQFRALGALGYESWAREELARQHALLDARDAEAVRAWSARSRASLLVDPAHLGRFRWLLLATPGLPQPAWHRQALVADDAETSR
jgi:NADH dehydrogenase [ubiquinone] 1 alpha subcomplex assembly factor 7